MTVSERHDKELEDRLETGPGTVLKAERVGRGMELEEVASTLHVPLAVIWKLEADDYEGLPPDTFTRGYLRAYARLLELDPEPLLARYPGGSGAEQRPLRVSAPVKTSPDITPGLLRGFLGGGVLAVVVGLGVWFYSLEDGEDPVAAAPQDGPELAETPMAAEPAGEQPGVVDADPDAELAREPDDEQLFTDDLAGPRDPEQVVGDTEPSDAVDDVVDETPRAAEESPVVAGTPADDPEETGPVSALDSDVLSRSQQAAGAAEPATEPPVAAAEEPAAAATGNGEELELEFSGPSWVEVYDADGQRLMYGLVQEQGRERVRGTAPFSVVIGDASHVLLVYQGEPVDLGQTRPGRVVRAEIPN